MDKPCVVEAVAVAQGQQSPSSSDSVAEKGKGKGKAPPLRPGAAAAKPKAKAKAAPGFAPNMKAKGRKIDMWNALSVIAVQSEDGHFDAEVLGQKLNDLASSLRLGDEGEDFVGQLASLHGEVGASVFARRLLEKFLDVFRKQSSGVMVRTVGNGRGNSERVVDSSNQLTELQIQERVTTLCEHLASHHQAALGIDFIARLDEWLASKPYPDGVIERVDELIDKWTDESWVAAPHGQTKAISDEERQRREEEHAGRREAKRREEDERQQFWRGLQSRSLEDIPWWNLRTYHHCHGGTGGAFLAQIGDGEAVVLKPQGHGAVVEAVAVQVAALLGVRVAQNRVVSDSENMFPSMCEAFSHAEPLLPEHKLSAAGTLWTKKYVALVEFVPGSMLQGVEGQAILHREHANGVLHAVGELIALDCMTNNLDRVPAIWDNDGNFGNIMVDACGKVIGIDQQVVPIVDPAGLQQYLDRLRDFVLDARQGRVGGSEAAARIKIAFYENCGVELTEVQCEHVLEGASRVFARASQLHSTTLEADLKCIDVLLTRLFSASTAHVGLGRLDFALEFVSACFAAAAGVFDQEQIGESSPDGNM